MAALPNFSIITPSFKQPDWLRLCLASVADQQGVTVEHIVQDACSGPEVEAVVAEFPSVTFFSEKDAGMYDAVNRGFGKARGDILAYLNCDEQYLPGVLEAVARHFADHPELDVVFADMLVTETAGEFICYRAALEPHRLHTLVSGNLSFATCSMFLRRKVVQDLAVHFDTRWKDVGDADFGLRLLDSGVRMGVLRRFTSIFTDTGENMNILPNAEREKREMARMAPTWAQRLRNGIILHYRLRKILAGVYWRKPFSYAIYTLQNPRERRIFRVDKPTIVWKGR